MKYKKGQRLYRKTRNEYVPEGGPFPATHVWNGEKAVAALSATCSTFYCDYMIERVCCHDCPEIRRTMCVNRCRNSPDKCGLYIGPGKAGPE